MTEKHDEKKVLFRADFCDTAKAIITTDRNQQYGEPEDNFAVIAELWSTYLAHLPADDCGPILRPSDVALMMTLFKIGRAATALEPKDDTIIDAIGYMACAGELQTQQRVIAQIERMGRESAEAAEGIDHAMEELAEASGKAYRAAANDEKIANSVDEKLNMHGNGEKPHICASVLSHSADMPWDAVHRKTVLRVSYLWTIINVVAWQLAEMKA